jgi:hypothetical protein
MVVGMWKRIRIQNIHLMIFHHDNIPPWRTIIKVEYTSPYAMNRQKMFLQQWMQKLLGWNLVV